MKKIKPNTKLPRDGKLIKPFSRKIGGWVEMEFDAEVTRLGLTWYRIKGGMSGDGDREDWVADIPSGTLCVHDYHWNGEAFGPSYGSFDNACLEETKLVLGHIQSHIEELKSKTEDAIAAREFLKKALGK